MKNLLHTLLRAPLAWLTLSLAACGGGSGPDNTGGAPTFAKSYGGPARDQATAAVPRPGGGYAFAGTLNNRGSGSGRISGLFGDGREGDLWVTALDTFGDVQWQRSYGRAPVVPTGLPASGSHDGVEYLRLRAALDAENDGLRNGAWLVGRLRVLEPNEGARREGYTERGTDLVITRLDANNQVLFSRAYDSGPFPGPLSYFFSGEQTSEVVGGVDIWPTADGGAIALADASATLSEDGRAVTRGAIYLVKVDAAGDRQASAVFPLDDGRATRRLHVRAAPGGAVAAYNFGDGMQVTRFDVSTGSVAVRWRRNVEGGEWPFDLLAADDDRNGALDGVVIAGRTNLAQLGGWGDGIHGFVMKLDADGDELWRHRMGDEVGALASTCVTAGTPCRYVAAGAERSSVLVRALDATSGDLRAEGRPSDLPSAIGIRHLAAQDRFQLLATESAGYTDQADYLRLFTLDRDLGTLDEAPIRGLSRIASIDDVVPDAGDDHLALGAEGQRLFQINQFGNAGEIASLDQTESTLERAFAVQALVGADGSDAGFVVAGEASFKDRIGDIAAWVLRLDAAGGIVWQKRLDGFRMLDWQVGFGEAADLLRTTPDGGFVIGGSSDQPRHHRVVKLRADGNIAWSTRALEPSGGELRALRVAADGSMLVAGGDSSPRAWVARLGANGEVQWTHEYAALSASDPLVIDASLAATDLRVTSDGGSLLVGTATRPAQRELSDAAAIRLDAQGAVLWAMRYPFGQVELLRNVRVAPSADGGFVIAASAQNRPEAVRLGLFNLLLFKIDANGRVAWSQRYGGLYEEIVHGIEPLPDGGFVISAQSDSFGDYSEAWVLRIGPDGRIVEGCNADRGRPDVIAQPLPVTRGDYALHDSAAATAPADIRQVTTNVVAGEPRGVVVARQCFGNAGNDPGAPSTSRTLTVRQAGESTGVISSTPPGIVCGTAGGGVCSAAYAEASLVSLRVDIGSVRNFSAWGAGCESVSGGFGEVCAVRLDADKTIDVIFSAAPPTPPPPPAGPFTLTVMIDRLGGFIGTTDGEIGCAVTAGQPRTCSARYAAGSNVDLYAAPLPGGNVLLESWQGDCAGFAARPNITLTMDRDYTCRAVFVSAP